MIFFEPANVCVNVLKHKVEPFIYKWTDIIRFPKTTNRLMYVLKH
jgi:hypothetical protein